MSTIIYRLNLYGVRRFNRPYTIVYRLYLSKDINVLIIKYWSHVYRNLWVRLSTQWSTYELDWVHSDHDSFVCQYPNSGFCKSKRIIIFSQLDKNNNILKIGLGLAARLWFWKTIWKKILECYQVIVIMRTRVQIIKTNN